MILYIDLWTHEWYHTPDHLYKSTNPIHPKFVGVNAFYQLLEKLGFCDKQKHKDEHHAERIENNHLTTDWIDFCMPGLAYVYDCLGAASWARFLKFMKQHRGSELSRPVANYTRKDAIRFHSYLKLSVIVFTMLWSVSWNFVVQYLFPSWVGNFYNPLASADAVASAAAKSGNACTMWLFENVGVTHLSLVYCTIIMRAFTACVHYVRHGETAYSGAFMGPELEIEDKKNFEEVGAY